MGWSVFGKENRRKGWLYGGWGNDKQWRKVDDELTQAEREQRAGLTPEQAARIREQVRQDQARRGDREPQ